MPLLPRPHRPRFGNPSVAALTSFQQTSSDIKKEKGHSRISEATAIGAALGSEAAFVTCIGCVLENVWTRAADLDEDESLSMQPLLEEAGKRVGELVTSVI